MWTRRVFIKSGGIALLGFGAVPRFIFRTALAAAPHSNRKNVLIVLFQRGGADGLNMIVPHAEPEYYRRRPTIAISRPGSGEGAALDLDGFFGFHPALEPLLPLFRDGSLAAVQAAGSPHATRSHFDAQKFMETGVPGDKAVTDGWLNRYLHRQSTDSATPLRGVAVGATMPRILAGNAPALALNGLNRFSVAAGTQSRFFEQTYRSLYEEETDTLLSGKAGELFEALDLLRHHASSDYRPAAGAVYPPGRLSTDLRQVVQLIKADVGLEVAFVENGGWDHHIQQGGAGGRLALQLRRLALTLSAFCRDLGSRMNEVVLVTLSEFGRTVKENGSRGTDHGHANVMLLIGGAVRGGKVYGQWPGLRPEQLFQKRDLALTTDFRDVFAEVLWRHLDCQDASRVFPGFAIESGRFPGILA